MPQPLTKKRSVGWLVLEWVPRLVVAALFVYTGSTKIADPQTFIREVQAYQLGPIMLTHLVAFVLPWVEVLGAGLLLIGLWRREARLLIAIMLVVFVAAKGYVMACGRTIDCGCVPTDSLIHFLFDGPIGIVTNLVLLLLLAVESLLERRREPRRGPQLPAEARQAVPA